MVGLLSVINENLHLHLRGFLCWHDRIKILFTVEINNFTLLCPPSFGVWVCIVQPAARWIRQEDGWKQKEGETLYRLHFMWASALCGFFSSQLWSLQLTDEIYQQNKGLVIQFAQPSSCARKWYFYWNIILVDGDSRLPNTLNCLWFFTHDDC